MHEGGPGLGGVWFSLVGLFLIYRFLDWMDFFCLFFFSGFEKKTSHGQIFSKFYFLFFFRVMLCVLRSKKQKILLP